MNGCVSTVGLVWLVGVFPTALTHAPAPAHTGRLPIAQPEPPAPPEISKIVHGQSGLADSRIEASGVVIR
jgi:hypothetical protein